MQVQPAPLKCLSYFVTELVLTANPRHNPNDPVSLEFTDIMITSTAELIKDSKMRTWRVALRIVQNISDKKKNCPYNFAIALLGTFRVHPKYPEDKVEQLVKINGSSILYSSARQILWEAMSNGPFRSLMLPTVGFSDSPASVKKSKVAENPNNLP